MKVVFVYNAQSGSALSQQELDETCKTAGVEVTAFVPIGDSLQEDLQPHIENGEMIAVYGGDGTVGSVAGMIANTNAVLVPLPGGTLNHFTKDVDVSQTLTEALKRLHTLSPRTIDCAKVNNIWFVNNASIGLYPFALQQRDAIEEKLGKWPAAVVSSWRAFLRFKTYRVTIDGKTFRTPFVFVGNNRYALSGLEIKRTDITKGELSVYIAKTASRWRLLKVAFLTLLQNKRHSTELAIHHPTSLRVVMKKKQPAVSHDGELSHTTSPVVFEIQPGALTILG
ncbi:MAG: diacylglycerol/lipid kinase family protein [Candidatus Saccharimonadales bacterium]